MRCAKPSNPRTRALARFFDACDAYRAGARDEPKRRERVTRCALAYAKACEANPRRKRGDE